MDIYPRITHVDASFFVHYKIEVPHPRNVNIDVDISTVLKNCNEYTECLKINSIAPSKAKKIHQLLTNIILTKF